MAPSCSKMATLASIAATTAAASSATGDAFLSPAAGQLKKAPKVPGEAVTNRPLHSSQGAEASASNAALAGVAVGSFVAAAQMARSRNSRSHAGGLAGRAKQVSLTAVATLDRADADTSTQLSPEELLENYVKERGGTKAIRKILIANNGMAATKAILSMKQWAYLELGHDNVFEFVVMATPEDLDANAEFIRLANTYVEVPGGKNVNNYANVDLICETAQTYGVDAVWPGWGHASENPKLPAGLAKLGISFIGPTSPVMSVLGDKIAANILAQTAGVPSIPWSGDGLTANLTEEGTIPSDTFEKATIHSVDEAIACADKIGYPVMLKASEGGGGKGIRMCANKAELEQNYPQVVNEVPGSPVFMMQLCTGARHIEVQIVGDKHGNAVALNGRDCSTQRRFQKIFEEGPPTIVPKDTFREMEKAAQRLTQNIGYIGAGTVEYLYNAKSNEFYFLELNPRLQVEHPVTEELTQVNMPATQLQVIMGIPLENIPQVRRFYGRDEKDLTDGIDFLEDDYIYPNKHVIAARITAENPDDGFKPTSGRIQRIRFQSSVSCWGYFSVGANGGIHEFADSQFGHIFAHGPSREDARKALMLSLKNMDVVGEIRNPVEYLVELAATDAFRDNTIDTSWLDGLIKEKSVALKYDNFDVVFYAAVFRALQAVEARKKEIMDTLTKGQLGEIQRIGAGNKFPIEITFEGQKYTFSVERGGSDILIMEIAGKKITAKVRSQPDGAVFVSVGDSVMKVYGTEEALGLRLRLEGIATIMLPTIYDPSELRSEFNGKIVRYLQDNGAAVKEGEPYVELEAMKMIMPVKATATGKITQLRGAGSIVSAGELLGSLELDDPSSVQTVAPFTGDFKLSALEGDCTSEESLKAQVDLVLDGYAPAASPSQLVQKLFSETQAPDVSEVATGMLEKFLSVEEKFASLLSDNVKTPDQVYLALIAENQDNLDTVMELALAHSQLASRSQVVLSTLRVVKEHLKASPELKSCVERLTKLPEFGETSEVVLLAEQVSAKLTSKPVEERVQALRSTLESDSIDMDAIVAAPASEVGVDLLGVCLGDDSATVRTNALEAYIRRTHRSFALPSLKVAEAGPSKLSCQWEFQYPGVESGTILRSGFCILVPSFEDIPTVFEGEIPLEASGDPKNKLQIIVGPDAFPSVTEKTGFYSTSDEFEAQMPKFEAWLKDASSTLEKCGVRDVTITCLQSPFVPRNATFGVHSEWKEISSRRDMRPTFGHLLEINRLSDEYDLERVINTVGRNSQVFVGTKKGAVAKGKRGPPKTIFVRMITHTMKAAPGQDSWMVGPESLLLAGIDEIERARLDPTTGQSPSGNIFAHLMWLVDDTPENVDAYFEGFMNQFVAKHGGRLQKMKVDEIVLKIGIGKAETGLRSHTLRVTASSTSGEYLRLYGLLETEDPLTGNPTKWVDVKTNSDTALDVFSKNQLELRRTIARAAGSTYVPEFLGMMKIELIKRWEEYSRQRGGKVQIPTDIFCSEEFVIGEDGELAMSNRSPGSNTIGMVAWKCTMQTPEYPAGRDVVVVANDVTHQAGSFGVAEDVFFQKVSEYARKNGLPRVYISCNSGARVGLVEELKPYIKAKWVDDANPGKGFEYLYLDEEDYNRFESGTVQAREVEDGGAKHYALDAIIGAGLKSTAGGIGVENLQGSGLIAGETARAYDEVFTLSYITGRSVGIGAYLNRLGQRTIQMVQGPMILTGFGALNKLLGKTVYTSQDQLGGPQVMVPNGVTHQLVQSDSEGVSAILDWLSFVPKDCWSTPPVIQPVDPVDRDITFTPSKRPYDPRNMLAGVTTPEGQKLSGFFDDGTFQEYLSGWGKSVVVGRGKLGGVPMGCIAVETRSSERRVPADPANPASQEVVEPQAGQVWFPDSAFKTATAIKDFNRGENLPLMIFANWRGFSGGTRDMYNEVLKFGAQIVDALVDYKSPVYVYIPPGGELRGGAWVVIDPAINPDQMEMYADVESRGGILEPAGIVEVKFRKQQQIELMHRLDPKLKELDEALESLESAGSSEDDGPAGTLKSQVKAREESLLPLYTQIACEFADLHDRAGRMEAKGVIRQPLEWKRAREYFYWRVRRQLLEQDLVAKVMSSDPALSIKAAREIIAAWEPSDVDREVVEFLEKAELEPKLEQLRVSALKRRIADLVEQLPESERDGVLSA